VLRFLLVIVFVGLIAAWLLGYVPGQPSPLAPAVAPQADRPIDPDVARQRGAQVGEQVADGVNRLAQGVDDAALTAKIKSKMALDDAVRALDIDVDTKDATVTLTGRVDSDDTRQRAVRLARETAGVRNVVDRLAVTR
jgi:hypothetical protein